MYSDAIAKSTIQQKPELCANGRSNSQQCANNAPTMLCSVASVLQCVQTDVTTPKNTQHNATGYANGRNMWHPTVLGVVGQQCYGALDIRLALKKVILRKNRLFAWLPWLLNIYQFCQFSWNKVNEWLRREKNGEVKRNFLASSSWSE